MSRITVLTVALCMLALSLEAQNKPFPDGVFENCWEWKLNPIAGQPGKTNYWDFKGIYFLTTLNSLHELEGDMGDAPLTVFRMDGADVYDGNYSVKLVSCPMILGEDTIFLPGVAATLSISLEPMACYLGEPFTSRPDAIKGWYKYTPENGDSAAIEIFLQKKGVILGKGKQIITDKVSDWTSFDVPVAYTSQETPDTIVVIFSASGNYDFTSIETLMKCKGQKNSTLCLDNIAFEYPQGIKEMFVPAVKLNIFPNPSTERVSIQIAKQTTGTIIIYDYLSRKVGEYSIEGTQVDIDVRHYEAGSYLINVVENDRIITTGRFLVGD